MSGPLVTVVIPAHNAAGTIEATLSSILRQTHRRIEVIVVDDGSTDNTVALVERAEDPRIRVVRRPAPSGVDAARNAGFREARGEYVGFIDADDVWTPEKVAFHVDAMERTGAGAAYSHVQSIDAEGRPASAPFRPAADGDVLADALVANFFGCGSNVIARRDVLATVPGPFSEELRHYGDWYSEVELARRTTIALVPEAQVYYRAGPNQMSTEADSIAREGALFLDRIFAASPDYAHLRPIAAARLHRYTATRYLRRRDTRRAGGHLRAALRLDPAIARQPVTRRVIRQYLMWRHLPPLVAGRSLDLENAVRRAVGSYRM